MSSRLRIIFPIVLVAYWGLMFWGTHKPSDDTPVVANDKLLHFVAYAGLTFLLSLSLFWWQNPQKWIWIPFVVLTYGAIDELTQPSFGRSAEVADWVADAFGCGIGLLSFFVCDKLIRRKAKVVGPPLSGVDSDSTAQE